MYIALSLIFFLTNTCNNSENLNKLNSSNWKKIAFFKPQKYLQSNMERRQKVWGSGDDVFELQERQLAVPIHISLLDNLLGNLQMLVGRQFVSRQRFDNALQVRLADKAVFVEICCVAMQIWAMKLY